MVDAGVVVGFAFAAFGTIIAISNPLSTALAFLIMTEDLDIGSKKRIAMRAIRLSTVIMVLFALIGAIIFEVMGITIGAFVIAGGVILFTAGAGMLRPSRLEVLIPEPSDDIALTPMTLPFISGAGTLASIVLLSSQAQAVASSSDIVTAVFCFLVLFAAIATVLILSYIGMVESDRLEDMLTSGATMVLTRLMGLIVMAVGVEFFLRGIEYILPEFVGLL
jgi:multiple antibiotic resistance protein